MYDEETSKLGVCILSGKEYRLYKVETNGRFTDIKLLTCDTERLLKQHKSGGQSAQRFCRIRKNYYDKYVDEVSETIISTFMKNNNTEYIVDKFIIAGPTLLKSEIIKDDNIKKYILPKIMKIMTTESITDKTINEIVATINMSDILCEDIDDKLKELITIDYDKLVFGEKEIFNDENDISKIYVTLKMFEKNRELINELLCKDKSLEIIKTKSKELDKYGGIIGERRFVIAIY